jgi:hypothetical protein
MKNKNGVSALTAAKLTKGQLENEILDIAQQVELDLGIGGELSRRWLLISKDYILTGRGINDWEDGGIIFDDDFQDKSLSEMLTIVSESEFGDEDFALKLERDGRIYVSKAKIE